MVVVVALVVVVLVVVVLVVVVLVGVVLVVVVLVVVATRGSMETSSTCRSSKYLDSEQKIMVQKI